MGSTNAFNPQITNSQFQKKAKNISAWKSTFYSKLLTQLYDHHFKADENLVFSSGDIFFVYRHYKSLSNDFHFHFWFWSIFRCTTNNDGRPLTFCHTSACHLRSNRKSKFSNFSQKVFFPLKITQLWLDIPCIKCAID